MNERNSKGQFIKGVMPWNWGKKGTTIKKCLTCGKDFESYPSAKRRYCSQECFHLRIKEYTFETCKICGKKFRIDPYRKGEAKFCSIKCHGKWMIGKPAPHPLKKGHIPWNKGTKGMMNTWNKGKEFLAMRGKNNPRWKGGITPENQRIRQSLQYKLWRKVVFEHDNYICWICEVKGIYLHAHHLKGFAKYPKLRFTKSNGVTLCKFCHKTYTKFGRP